MNPAETKKPPKKPTIYVHSPRKNFPKSSTSKKQKELNRVFELTQNGVEILNPAEPKKQ